jgi:hypothetical protein
MSYYRNHLPLSGASGQSTGYTIDQSIRFNDGDSSYMQKVLSSGNRRLLTLSLWLKLGSASTYGIFGVDTTNASGRLNNRIYISDGHFTHIQVDSSGNNLCNFKSLRKLRDFSAWYHLVLVVDTENAIQSERLRLYINGERENNFDNNEGGPFTCSQNLDTNFNNGEQHLIGALAYNSMGNIDSYFDGYMAEIHYLDGYGYDSSYFGEFKENTDIWIPKEYTGSYGTNGFYLKGESSGALGNDSSGNNNDFSTSGLAANDQQPDSPTNNHSVFNSLEAETLISYSEGNLAIAYSGSSARNLARSTIRIPSSTDAFFEMVMTSNLGSGVDFAIGIEDGTAASDNSNTIYNNAYVIREDGTFIDQSSSGSYGVSFTNTDVIGVWRKANGDLVFYKNGTAMNSGTPAKTGLTGQMFFVAGPFNGASAEARFASSKWTNTPTGVSSAMAVTTKNLGI